MPLVLGINVAKAEQPPPPCHPNPNAPADETTVRNRGDIVNLPGPLKDRLAQLANRPHTYLPIQAFAEAHNDDGSPKPSRSMACLPDRFSTLGGGRSLERTRLWEPNSLLCRENTGNFIDFDLGHPNLPSKRRL
jgi:hypothetical protein